MQRPRLLFTLALVGAVVAACDDELTSPNQIPGPSSTISDGATGGISKDVFFLPPIVPDPTGTEFFDAGAFNPNLTSAVIRVCHWVNQACEPVATFGSGSNVTGPVTISVQEEHYLALWHTDESNPALVPGDAYRIQVFADADVSGEPLAWADVEVAATGRELRNIDTDQAIALLDGRTLPIKVRFENGVRCTTAKCIARPVDAAGATVVLESGEGALILQEGWLPPNVPQVTVTVQWEPTANLDECVQREGFTGRSLVAQTRSCLHITTDPDLTPGEATGIQQPAFVFICKQEPTGLSEGLEALLQIIKADAGLPLEALRDVDHATLIQLGFTPTCVPEDPGPIGGITSDRLLHFANAGVRSLTDFVSRTFGVGTLHAIDLGQGGEIIRFGSFSRFTLGVMADLEPVGSLPDQATVGEPLNLSATVLGRSHHEPGDVVTEGIAGLDMVFTVTVGTGTLSDPSDDVGGGATSLTIPSGEVGTASVTLFVGDGTNTVTVVAMQNGEAVSETLTFSVTGAEGLVGSLRFVAPPTTTVSGETMTPPVTIEALDPSGNRITDVVRVTIGHPPDSPDGCQILQTSALAVNGLATFENIQLGGACEGVRMGARGGGNGWTFPIILSEPFDILDPDQIREIVFGSDRTGNFEIFAVGSDGSGILNLTNNPGSDFEPVWSPNGTRIAFQSRRADNVGDIFVMNADGSRPVNLTASPTFELSPSWSPDGAHIAFMERGEIDRIFVMNADGTGRRLLAGDAETGDAGFPAWSPDGTRIAFATTRDGNPEIYVMNADGTNAINLTNHTGFDLTPIWSPDGTRLIWNTTRDGSMDVFVMNADGSNPVNLTNNGATDRAGGWSADGQFIVFDSNRDGDSELYIMRADGSDVRRLTTSLGEDLAGTWRP